MPLNGTKNCQACRLPFPREDYAQKWRNEKPNGREAYCPSCMEELRERRPIKRAAPTLPFEERFWRRVARPSDAPNVCWEWQGGSTIGGYGNFGTGECIYLAHRVAYELAVGPIPPGLLVMHSCDNPRCCRPSHLSVGTYADNTADMMAKGRGSKGPQKVSR